MDGWMQEVLNNDWMIADRKVQGKGYRYEEKKEESDGRKKKRKSGIIRLGGEGGE